jgi:hypothetical protein
MTPPGDDKGSGHLTIVGIVSRPQRPAYYA